MSGYTLTVGLEIHAELKTRTKMFCACINDPDEETPNKNICPVCMAHPGTLPVINKEAVKKVLLVGAALKGTRAGYTEFDRKNYFYPDIPKGYQLSQYQYPLVRGGVLRGVAITRVHLEEDTARSQHIGEKSLIDYNRAGVPLMELVTEPVIHSAKEAGDFARELQLMLRYLDAGEAQMEKGEMRVEANISVGKGSALGTKVEVKNLNSFRSVERAIAYEFDRQTQLLDNGETIEQETRGWDEVAQNTFSQRKKESSHDYRYFPDPDLPKLSLGEVEEFQNLTVPELPEERRARYLALNLKPEDANMFVADSALGVLFDDAVRALPEKAALIANYLASDIAGLVAKQGEGGLAHITGTGLAGLIRMVSDGTLSSRGAKDTLTEVFVNGGDITAVAVKYTQQSDARALEAIAQKVVGANPSVVQDYKAGKEAAMQFLVGQGMKESKGSANPQALQGAIQKILG